MKQKLWCCVADNLEPKVYYLYSLSGRKKDSIDMFCAEPKHWEVWKRFGVKCVKVEVTIKPI